jgi:hypothetical protein
MPDGPGWAGLDLAGQDWTAGHLHHEGPLELSTGPLGRVPEQRLPAPQPVHPRRAGCRVRPRVATLNGPRRGQQMLAGRKPCADSRGYVTDSRRLVPGSHEYTTGTPVGWLDVDRPHATDSSQHAASAVRDHTTWCFQERGPRPKGRRWTCLIAAGGRFLRLGQRVCGTNIEIRNSMVDTRGVHCAHSASHCDLRDARWSGKPRVWLAVSRYDRADGERVGSTSPRHRQER